MQESREPNTPVDPARGLVFDETFESFPVEILEAIVQRLPISDICNLRQVNRQMRELVFNMRERLLYNYKGVNPYYGSMHPVIIDFIIKDFPNIQFDCFPYCADGTIDVEHEISMAYRYPKNFSNAVYLGVPSSKLFVLSPAFNEMKKFVVRRNKNLDWIFKARGEFAFNHLEQLILTNCGLSNVNLSSVRVKTIKFNECTDVIDIAQIKHIPEIHFHRCNNFSNWHLLGDQERLVIYSCDITDIHHLGRIKKLTLYYCKKIHDISALADVPYLEISHCENIDSFNMLGKQTALVLDRCSISDATHLSRVKKLSLMHTKITDVSPLANVQILYILSKCIRDISALRFIPTLSINCIFEGDNNIISFPGANVLIKEEGVWQTKYQRFERYPRPEIAALGITNWRI